MAAMLVLGAMGEILEKTYVRNERTRRVLINDFGRKPESVETLYIGVDQGSSMTRQGRSWLGSKRIEHLQKIVRLFCFMSHSSAKATVPHG
ncbi:MAG: hypothetical protein ACLR4Z_09585 [Butyricicoccaceae bacterium]